MEFSELSPVGVFFFARFSRIHNRRRPRIKGQIGPTATPRRELITPLDRTSLSALLNAAEGNGRRQGRQRARFFDDARGSAIECAASLDASAEDESDVKQLFEDEGKTGP
jgi:hypothetical protein